MNDKDLLRFCAAAYADDEVSFKKIAGLEENSSYKNPVQVSHYFGQTLHKFIVEFDNKTVIALRGTHTRRDFLNDLCCRMADFNGVDVHAGFLDEDSAEILPRLDFNVNKKVYLTGHSLGGALAVLFADKLANFQWKTYSRVNIEVVTFGAPMVGGIDFKQQIEGKVTGLRNYVCGDDLVPSLPPAAFGYVRIGTQVHVGKQHSWWNPIKYFSFLKSHQLTSYQEALSNN